MTYKFVDTVRQTTAATESLPDEAIRINGKWLENEVSGYRTLHVSGRELISTEINTTTIAGMNGEIFLNSRIPARVITVRYLLAAKSNYAFREAFNKLLLAAKSNYAFREAFNKLSRLLQPTQVEVVFADEPDKYFIGTKSEIENPEPGSNITTGEFKIFCTDPFKYSTTEKTFQMDEPDKYFIGTKSEIENPEPGSNITTGEFKIFCTDPFKYSTTEKTFQMDSTGTIIVENSGSVPVPIRYEITHNHENGYVGIASEHGAMEFGKREEADGVTYQQMECLLNINNFISAPNDTNGHDVMHPTYGCKGTLKTMSYNGRTYLCLDNPGTASGLAYGGLRTLTIPADSNGATGAQNWYLYGQSYNGRTYLCLDNPGTASGLAYGGLRTLTIPADSNGATGAQNWYLYGHLCFWASQMGQTGEMTVNIVTADNKLIAGMTWYKTDMSGNTGVYEITVGGQASSAVNAGHVLRSWTYQCSHTHSDNPWYGDWGHVDLKKEGSKITFFYWGQYHSFNIPEIANLVAAKVQVSCKVWAQQPNKRMYCAGFDTLNFYKSNVTKWRDVPNRYWQGSKLEIDGNTGQFLVAGMPKPQDEILGTKWFKAEPGETEVKLYFSSFCSPKPTVVARIREAWL